MESIISTFRRIEMTQRKCFSVGGYSTFFNCLVTRSQWQGHCLGIYRMSQTFLTWNGNGKSLEPPILRFDFNDSNSNPRIWKILRLMLEGWTVGICLGAVVFLTQQDSDAILSPKHRTGTALFTNPLALRCKPKRMTGGFTLQGWSYVECFDSID